MELLERVANQRAALRGLNRALVRQRRRAERAEALKVAAQTAEERALAEVRDERAQRNALLRLLAVSSEHTASLFAEGDRCELHLGFPGSSAAFVLTESEARTFPPCVRRFHSYPLAAAPSPDASLLAVDVEVCRRADERAR